MESGKVHQFTILTLAILISIIFAFMIKGYFMTLFLAGLFSALCQPLYRRILKKTKERRSLASALTLLIVILIIIIPLGIILSIVVVQAVQVGQATGPWIQETLSRPDLLLSRLENLPVYDYLIVYQDDIITKVGELVSAVSTLLVTSLTQITSSTVHAFFLLFIFLYTMFFFLKDGGRLMDTILYYLPLDDETERRLLNHFTSVTRATLKGTFLIGLIQGVFAAVGFAVAGISSVVFWGLMMTVLSIIPIVGASLIWIPAVIILAVSGQIARAVILGIYCALLVGSVDNILRPVLVGKDTKMHELLILLGTLGGLALFGIWGVIIGPVVAALFVSIWDLYGETFAAYLPGNRKAKTETEAEAPPAEEGLESESEDKEEEE